MVYLVGSKVGTLGDLIKLLNSHRLEVVWCGSAQECLSRPKNTTAACVIVDIPMHDLCGPEFIRKLKSQTGAPVICISDSPDVRDVVSAIQAGAVEFFRKPIIPDVLVSAIRLSLAYHRRIREKAN